jgi:thiamine-monophosphate kinase
VLCGIGDDCAIIQPAPGEQLLVTTDLSLEGVHFRREWHPPESVGHRALARGLSDIAAMGGEPVAIFLSLALPCKLPQSWVDRFFSGLLKLARRLRVGLAGGDTSESPSGIMVDVAALGSIPNGAAIRRSSARRGDRIYVSGELGASSCALELLASGAKKLPPGLSSRHFFPVPRIELGRLLREKAIPTALIDISDGLSTDLFHLCQESGTGAEIWEDAVPRAGFGRASRRVDIGFALHGGEDYELLFTARPSRRVPRALAGVQITEIGRVSGERGRILLRSRDAVVPFEPHGWEHFRKPS